MSLPAVNPLINRLFRAAHSQRYRPGRGIMTGRVVL